jgi:tryptophanyl-tRNA synthetase
MTKRLLTGVKPTHVPHIGNYLGAIRPSLDLQKDYSESFLFIADQHALISTQDGKSLREYTHQVAACWLACGLDPTKTVLYRQSDIPEIFELNWILSCVTPKGFLNRAHAYKAKLQENAEAGGRDPDDGVSVGLFTYPLLMTADILMFNANAVPVGEDQVQHLEIARDIAEKFNRTFGDAFFLPEAIAQKGKLVPGLDGRKMSKSYGNHIPLFLESKKLRKLVMKIVTDSLPPEAPKSTEGNTVFQLYQEFANPAEVDTLRARYAAGIGWGEAKEYLFLAIERHFSEMSVRYHELMASPEKLDGILADGAHRARTAAAPVLAKAKRLVGL